MRRISLTVLLSTTALLACFVAPRLTAWVAPTAAASTVAAVSAIAPRVDHPVAVQRAMPIAEVVAAPAPMDPSTPLLGAHVPASPPMSTRTADPLLIPELDVPLPPTRRVAAPVVVHPQPEPIPEEFWDDCMFCGMG